MKSVVRTTLRYSGFLPRLGIALCTAGWCGLAPALATELEPNEFVTAPPGTTAFLGYFVYGDHESYQPASGPSVSHNTHLDDVLGIARAAEYFDVGDTEFLVEFLQPFGRDSNARIGGTRFDDSTGAGDTTLAAAIWPINDTANQRYLGVTLYLVVPDGAYDRSETINLGGNRMVYDPEIAFHQGIDSRWSFDVSGDFISYGDNSAPDALPNQTLSEDLTFQVQAFINYIWANSLQTSIGYESEFGGRTQLNRVAAAGKTDFEEARFVASYPVAPDFQVLGEVNHQFTNVGGFRQDVGVTIRTLYTFQAPSPAPAPEQVPPPPALAAPAAVPAPEQQREFQVFFDFDQSNITDAASRVIQAAADVVRSGGIAHITVTGHTDTVGTARYNQALSERRAGSVRTRLVSDGVDGGEISTVGAGKTGLLVPTADGVREPQNRRAVIELR